MLRKLIALGCLGYLAYRSYDRHRARPAFADNQDGAAIRDAGPQAMRDRSSDGWTSTDEASDESFPASDPPATY